MLEPTQLQISITATINTGNYENVKPNITVIADVVDSDMIELGKDIDGLYEVVKEKIIEKIVEIKNG